MEGGGSVKVENKPWLGIRCAFCVAKKMETESVEKREEGGDRVIEI